MLGIYSLSRCPGVQLSGQSAATRHSTDVNSKQCMTSDDDVTNACPGKSMLKTYERTSSCSIWPAQLARILFVFRRVHESSRAESKATTSAFDPYSSGLVCPVAAAAFLFHQMLSRFISTLRPPPHLAFTTLTNGLCLGIK